MLKIQCWVSCDHGDCDEIKALWVEAVAVPGADRRVMAVDVADVGRQLRAAGWGSGFWRCPEHEKELQRLERVRGK